MESKDRFMELSLDEMCDAIANRLAKEREECRQEAEVKLGELFDKKRTLEDERDQLLADAAYERVSSLTRDQVEKFDIYEDSLEDKKVIMKLGVKFVRPDRVAGLDSKISEINAEIAITKNKAVLDLNNEALNAKDRDIAFLARRMVLRIRELEKQRFKD